MTRLDFMQDAINNNEEYYDFGEQEICSQFGCGKKLRPEEKLYGDKCITHNGEKLLLINKSFDMKKICILQSQQQGRQPIHRGLFSFIAFHITPHGVSLLE